MEFATGVLGSGKLLKEKRNRGSLIPYQPKELL